LIGPISPEPDVQVGRSSADLDILVERFTAPLMVMLGVYLLDEALIRIGTLTARDTSQ
jgi:hypothetical protein